MHSLGIQGVDWGTTVDRLRLGIDQGTRASPRIKRLDSKSSVSISPDSISATLIVHLDLTESALATDYVIRIDDLAFNQFDTLTKTRALNPTRPNPKCGPENIS